MDNPDANTKEIVMPLEHDTCVPKETKIATHGSPTTGYEMGEKYNKCFSECFGQDVELVYMGQNRRQVLRNLSPNLGAAARSSEGGSSGL